MIISFMLKYSTLSEPTHQFFSKVPLSTQMHFSNTLHFLTTHLFQRNYGLHGAKSCQNAPTQPYLDTWIVQILKSTSILMTSNPFLISIFIYNYSGLRLYYRSLEDRKTDTINEGY